MVILLDLDDTVFIHGKIHPRFGDFLAWVGEGDHEVIVWSSHEDGSAIASLMKFGYLSKEHRTKPEADVLIDDCCQEFSRLCSANVLCSTLDNFMKSVQNNEI